MKRKSKHWKRLGWRKGGGTIRDPLLHSQLHLVKPPKSKIGRTSLFTIPTFSGMDHVQTATRTKAVRYAQHHKKVKGAMKSRPTP